MSIQPEHVDLTYPHPHMGNVADAVALVQNTAQRAILPRRLEEGIYALTASDGSLQIIETPGYEQEREHDWNVRHADKPERVERQVTLLDVPSFLAYLTANTFNDGESPGPEFSWGTGTLEVWADVDRGTVTATLDGLDGWRNHAATLRLQKSREWLEWESIDGKLLKQDEFAEFIEDHLSTIGDPNGALLLEIAQTLSGTVGAKFSGKTILKDGSRSVHWEEHTEAAVGAKGDLKIPDQLTLVLRPFQGSQPVVVPARFRFRPIQGGGILIGVKMNEPERLLEDTFSMVVDEVRENLPVPVLNGRP